MIKVKKFFSTFLLCITISSLGIDHSLAQNYVPVIPAMISASTPAPYSIEGSPAAWSGCDTYKIFDGITSTFYHSGASTSIGWFKINLGADNEKIVVQYTIQDPGAGSTYSQAMLNSWTFQGSQDGSIWTVLDTQTGINWEMSQKREFTFSNSTAYQYYKINIIYSHGVRSSQCFTKDNRKSETRSPGD